MEEGRPAAERQAQRVVGASRPATSQGGTRPPGAFGRRASRGRAPPTRPGRHSLRAPPRPAEAERLSPNAFLSRPAKARRAKDNPLPPHAPRWNNRAPGNPRPWPADFPSEFPRKSPPVAAPRRPYVGIFQSAAPARTRLRAVKKIFHPGRRKRRNPIFRAKTRPIRRSLTPNPFSGASGLFVH